MENNKEIFELIERYFAGTLSSSEKIIFEQKRSTDASFAAEVDSYEKLVSSMNQHSKRKSLINRLNLAHIEMKKDVDSTSLRPTKVRNIFAGPKVWAAAASIALVISMSTYSLMNYVSPINNKEKAYYRELSLDLEKVKSSQKKIINEIKRGKPALKQASFGGTAIAISADGFILTSYHVVKGVQSVYIENKKFSRLKLKKVYTDPLLDLVIMKVDDDSFKTFGPLPFTFRKTDLDLGEKVFTLGYPKQDVVFGEGYISSVNGYEGDTSSYQIAVPVNPGQSGGPLFDGQGNLIGIVSGKHTEYEGSAFAVKANYLKKTILSNDSLNTNIKLPKVNYLKNQGKIQMIKNLQDYVFEVKGYN